MSFADHFSAQAAEYSRYRPSYPDALLDRVAALAVEATAAWDCATGNGQAAIGLAARFERVWATDGSADQIRAAMPHPRVTYSVGTAEASGLASASVDAVTVAQAAHWFDLPRFVAECRRVARPRSPVVLWGYTLARIAPDVDGVFLDFHARVEPYWPRGREILDRGYEHLAWDLDPIELEPMEMTADWDVEQMLGYLATWSSVAACRRATGVDPIERLAPELRAAWGPGARAVHWPLTLRAGRV